MRHRVGILGFGEWPRQAYLPVFREMEHVDVVAVAARTEATRRFARETLGPKVALHGDYREVLANDSIDVVMLALPNRMHVEALQAAVESGKHLFLEPPIGCTAHEIDRAMEVLDGCQQIVHVNLECRFLPVVDAVRTLLDEGVLGDVRMAKVRLRCDWGYGGGGYGKEIEKNGFFIFLGCWYLDLLDVVFPVPPVEASVTVGRAMNGGLADHGWANLRYPGDRIGQFEFNLVDVEEVAVMLDMTGTKGRLEVDLLAGTCRWKQKGRPWQQRDEPCSEPICGFSGMRESIAAFFEAIVGGMPSRSGVDVCRRVHQAVVMCAEREGGS